MGYILDLYDLIVLPKHMAKIEELEAKKAVLKGEHLEESK